MKILLLGDYSSLYRNLQEGLQELGHDAVLASYSDGWKEIPRDIDLGGGKVDLLSRIKRKLSPFLNREKLCNYDVVQYINSFYFYHPLFKNKYILDYVMRNNKKFFLSAAGDDAYYWKNGQKKLDYGPFQDFLKYDLKKSAYFMSSDKAYEFNKRIAEKSNGVIPIMYEYELSYRGCSKLRKTIPIPINLKKIRYKENKPSSKIVIFHGLNRYGYKGTRHVEEAFKALQKKYPNDLELVIEGGLPLKEYLKLMERVNIVIDQTYSYSLGMNGVYAMAMGKIVIGGAEPESLISLGVAKSPVINIKPNPDSIVKAIENILEHRNEIIEMGFVSRQFAQDNHCYINIARNYISEWNRI